MQAHRERVPIIITAVIIAATVFFAASGFNLANRNLTASAQTTPTCLNRVNVPLEELHWLYVPETASQLNTSENLFFLAGQLISAGVVNATDCPSNGLTLTGYANACGMDAARADVIAIQNLMNQPILDQWETVGVPPVLLKMMIRNESQYWPSRYMQTHYGYGHITNIGMRNALQWNSDLRYKVCDDTSAINCELSVPVAEQILASLVATCVTCEYGIDIPTATRSIDILAETVLGFCFQTQQLVFNATGWYSGLVVDYATIWKLTLMDYNAGSECVFDSVAAAFKITNGPVKWSDIKAVVKGDLCLRGVTYADTITAKYFNFPP